MVNSLRILVILLIGGIGVQTIYAKKETSAKDSSAVAVKKEAKKIAAKDSSAVVKDEAKEETLVKVDGILEIGFDNNYKYNKKNRAEGRIEYNRIGKAEVDVSLRPTKKVKAVIGFEYNRNDSVAIKTIRQDVIWDSRTGKVTDVNTIPEEHKIERSFTIDKLYAQYNPLNHSTIRFGYMKKSFGLEERTSLDERYFHKRSIINKSLEDFGFLDHDLTFQYRHELGKKFELRGGFSWTADSTRYLQNYSAEYDDKKNNLVLAAVIMHDFPSDRKNTTTYVSSLSYRRANSLFASEAELTYGINPFMKINYDSSATIFGARVKENFFVNTGFSTLQQVIPIAEAAIYSSDFKKDSTEYEAQLRAGLTLGFAKKSAFQWRNNYGIIYKIKEDEKKLSRRRIDSEVVVVF